jgi:hypothetical protein
MSSVNMSQGTAILSVIVTCALAIWAIMLTATRDKQGGWKYFSKLTYFVAPFLALLSMLMVSFDILM